MKSNILALVVTYGVFATCHPYVTSIESWSALQTTVDSKTCSGHLYGEFIIPRMVNADDNYVALQARDTTSTHTTTTTATSTSSTTPSTTTSSITTSSDTTTTSSTTPYTTQTTSLNSSTSTISSISTTSTTKSASTTSSSTTASTASATNSAGAELAEWNRKGNITAVIFGVCLIAVFSGISIAFCVSDMARKKRIAARELLKSTSTISTEPLVPSNIAFAGEHSSLMSKNNPLGDTPPRTAHSGGNDWVQTPETILRSEGGEDGDIDAGNGRNKTPVSLV